MQYEYEIIVQGMHYLTLTITAHAHGEALLKSTVLATVSIVLVHIAILRQPALVPLVLSHRPLEEALIR